MAACAMMEKIFVKNDCRNLKEARSSLEGLGLDVFETVGKQGYDINVLTDYDQKMNRYGMLLIV